MFETVLDYIARTNLFNFLLFASIIAYLFVKLNVIDSIEHAKNSVIERIEESEQTKSDSEENLKSVENKLEKLSEEIDTIINQSVDNAKLVGDKLLSDTNKTLENMKANSEKLVENRTELVKNDIFQRLSLASIEIARTKIIDELNNNNELHDKLIDESVEAIDGVDL